MRSYSIKHKSKVIYLSKGANLKKYIILYIIKYSQAY